MKQNIYTTPTAELIFECGNFILCVSSFSGSGSTEDYNYDGQSYNELD